MIVRYIFVICPVLLLMLACNSGSTSQMDAATKAAADAKVDSIEAAQADYAQKRTEQIDSAFKAIDSQKSALGMSLAGKWKASNGSLELEFRENQSPLLKPKGVDQALTAGYAVVGGKKFVVYATNPQFASQYNFTGELMSDNEIQLQKSQSEDPPLKLKKMN